LKSAAIANDVPVIVTTPSKKFAPVFVALTRFPVTKSWKVVLTIRVIVPTLAGVAVVVDVTCEPGPVAPVGPCGPIGPIGPMGP
jgi:hypothetical protein